MSKISSAQLKSFIDNIDHHQIYKLHMAQARQTRKMAANDPAVLAKIDVIEARIRQTYKDACAAKEAAQ